MLGDPQAVDLDLLDLESALLRAAVGDYAAEAAVLLLADSGHWLPRLQAAGLVSIALDGDAVDGGPWAAVQWGDLDGALRAGRISGTGGERRLLRAAASLAEGQPVDLADLTAGLDRGELTLLLAALAHAAGSHEHHDVLRDGDGLSQDGPLLGPVVAWPQRD
ncbi:hypothetical protein O2W14_14275 [Modestobacter sp. VKM Ac-2986]|uniref:hypothetical protein n=1 Tax=Modestobacter sp. VKM Ac-2986 TaxID=3004140 RepID=UPI0022AB6C90|nr:hypothetical protein [Modestobacter sp. VKM Ac-2986]MCZ2830002.1 hypothetical protein [Modestobacter sp. VKM Ac-2986]